MTGTAKNRREFDIPTIAVAVLCVVLCVLNMMNFTREMSISTMIPDLPDYPEQHESIKRFNEFSDRTVAEWDPDDFSVDLSGVKTGIALSVTYIAAVLLACLPRKKKFPLAVLILSAAGMAILTLRALVFPLAFNRSGILASIVYDVRIAVRPTPAAVIAFSVGVLELALALFRAVLIWTESRKLRQSE